ncbi:caspase domain-containing protein [Suillus subalutaceus]|uniref:caspase domain-containing protein n=1 Tax=Suillus subalutaceus TaxID=48586 RepID=UPI001B8844E4|nr:caspase domain-containing protein [Suillus subalutaceus]KAG1854417.1 caspase domain-containing protein [Suillus subalutaceus]
MPVPPSRLISGNATVNARCTCPVLIRFWKAGQIKESILTHPCRSCAAIAISETNGYQKRADRCAHAALPPSVPSYRFTYNERTAPDAWPAQHDPVTSRLHRLRTQSTQSLQQHARESTESLRNHVHSPYSAVRRPFVARCNCDPSDQIEIPQTIKVLIPHTRKKKALCIGINYKSQDRELRGCVNDAWNMAEFLKSSWNYAKEDIMVLTDEPYNLRYMPTKRNILSALRWLVKDAQPGDCLFFHYSGHGGRIIDLDGPRVDGHRVDGFEKAIHPVDWEHAGEIVTEVKPLPAGCRLIALFDSCYSGTVLDLRYIYQVSSHSKRHAANSRALTRYPQAHVVLFASCSDFQGSGGVIIRGGEFLGAMSSAFISSLTTNPTQTYLQVLASVQDILRRTQRQTPQLSSSYPIDSSQQCIL